MKKLRHKDITYLAKVVDEEVAEPGSKPRRGHTLTMAPTEHRGGLLGTWLTFCFCWFHPPPSVEGSCYRTKGLALRYRRAQSFWGTQWGQVNTLI